MEEWERIDTIKGTLAHIEMLKGRRKKLYQQGYNINYNSAKGQKQSVSLEQDIVDVDNEIESCYEDLSKLKHNKMINLTLTGEIQGDGRLQVPSNVRKKLDLNRGDVLEYTIRRKL